MAAIIGKWIVTLPQLFLDMGIIQSKSIEWAYVTPLHLWIRGGHTFIDYNIWVENRIRLGTELHTTMPEIVPRLIAVNAELWHQITMY